MKESQPFHWADQKADEIIAKWGHLKEYVCASGISPSGHIHIGNFREIITTDLIVRALKDKGKKVRFLYSWDDFDRFRKTPGNIKIDLNKYIGTPYSDIPDPFNCHKNYAEHFEKELEESISNIISKVDFISQSKMYKSCKYAEGIKKALDNKDKIIKILNKFREEPLPENWLPIEVYCEKCKKDSTEIISQKNYEIEYKCECGFSDKFDFRKKGIVKLIWRVDWPMRWDYEKVNFEPGGKDHSTPGGSYDTGKEIIKEVWKREPPSYQIYDFVIGKGVGGKMSSSLGNTILPKDLLEVYEPELLRFLFVGTRPNKEFSIPFDLEVIKNYEDYDRLERNYYETEIDDKQKRIYELSQIELQKKLPLQAPFRHLTTIIQTNEYDIKEILKEFNPKTEYEKNKLKTRINCAINWLKLYAPEDMKFKVQEKVQIKLNKQEKQIIIQLIKILDKKLNEIDLHNEFYKISEENKIEPPEFFKLIYKCIINKEKGPKLASFILTIGKDRVIKILKTA